MTQVRAETAPHERKGSLPQSISVGWHVKRMATAVLRDDPQFIEGSETIERRHPGDLDDLRALVEKALASTLQNAHHGDALHPA